MHAFQLYFRSGFSYLKTSTSFRFHIIYPPQHPAAAGILFPFRKLHFIPIPTALFPSLTSGMFLLPAAGSPRKEQNKFITTKKFPTTHHRCSRELNIWIITCASCRCVHFFASISCFVPQHSISAHTLTHPHQHPAL